MAIPAQSLLYNNMNLGADVYFIWNEPHKKDELIDEVSSLLSLEGCARTGIGEYWSHDIIGAFSVTALKRDSEKVDSICLCFDCELLPELNDPGFERPELPPRTIYHTIPIKRETWVHYKLLASKNVVELATLLEDEILRAGFLRRSAGAATALENLNLAGTSILDVIPTDVLVSAASASFTMPESDLELRLRLGEVDTKPFTAGSLLDYFTLRVNYRMDRRLIRQIAEDTDNKNELEGLFKESRRAYRLSKRLFDVVGAEKCIGVDAKYLTGDFFNDPPAFFFSRSEPCLLSELLEDPVDPAD